MSFPARILLGLGSVLMTLIIARQADSATLGAMLLALLGIHYACVRSVRLLLARFWPICLFAAGVGVLQFLGRGADLNTGLQIVFVFAAIRLVGGLCSSRDIAVPRHRLLYRLFLFMHFTRHFTAILAAEARRMLIARRRAAPRLHANGGVSSLVHSLAAILQRSLIRAERFYAAQWLKGIEA